MSAATMGAVVAPRHNPPLKLKASAIVGRLQHFATNGPAYVQFQATRSLARIIGLFDKASDALRELGLSRDNQQEPEQQPEEHSGLYPVDESSEEDDDYP